MEEIGVIQSILGTRRRPSPIFVPQSKQGHWLLDDRGIVGELLSDVLQRNWSGTSAVASVWSLHRPVIGRPEEKEWVCPSNTVYH